MYVKGMNKNMMCRGFQFEVGKEYKIDHGDKPLELCSDTVFHFCDSLQKVHKFYKCDDKYNRFFVIEALGEIITDNEKCGSDHIRIVREITGDELDIMRGTINGNTGLFNSGYMNSGDMNSGYRNSGDMNSGYRNSGIANKCDFSSGIFCNESDMDIRIFNKPSGMSLKEFINSKYYDALVSAPFELIRLECYSDKELATDEEKNRVGGRLIVKEYSEAWADWWDDLSPDKRAIIQQIPNFDAEIFKDITGIDLMGEVNE